MRDFAKFQNFKVYYLCALVFHMLTWVNMCNNIAHTK